MQRESLHAVTQTANLAVSNHNAVLLSILHSSTQRTWAVNSVLVHNKPLNSSVREEEDYQQFCSLVDASAVRESHSETRRVSVLRQNMKILKKGRQNN